MEMGGKGNVESHSRTSLIEVAERSRVRVTPTALSRRLECAYRRPLLTVLGEFEPLNVFVHRVDPKRHFLEANFWAMVCIIHPWVSSVSEFGGKIKIKKKRPYISPICPDALLGSISTNFGLRVRLVDLINCAKSYRNRLRGVDSVRVEVWPFPLDCYCSHSDAHARPCRQFIIISR